MFQKRRVLLLISILFVLILALLGIVLILLEISGALQARIILITIILGFYSFFGYISSRLFKRKSLIIFGLLSFFVYVVSFIYINLFLWSILNIIVNGRIYDFNLWGLIIAIVLPIDMAITSYVLSDIPKPMLGRLTSVITIFSSNLSSGLFITWIIIGEGNSFSLLFNLVIVFLILTVCGAVMLPLLKSFHATQ